MKKVILIAAIVIVAIVGLTSYSGKEEVKDTKNNNLIAQLTGGPEGTTLSGNTGAGNPGGLKKD